MNPRIAGTASAFPRNYYSQDVIREALKHKWAGKLDNPQVLDRFHANVGVEGRHLALPIPAYHNLKTWGDANNAWIDTAVELAKQALCRSLNNAGIGPEELSAIFFVSVTGIASPSIEARLINRMGLSRNIKRIPIFGLGCVAGAAGIARTADYIRAYPDQAAALVSVELCSLTWREDDLSAANLISTGLFGDGAAAVVLCGDERVDYGPRVLATRSVFYPDTEDVMGWDISEKGFKIVLSRSVPEMVTLHLREDVVQFLADHDMKPDDIGSWIMHTGGPKVLEATQEALGVPKDALSASWESLREVGNLSSASVLLVLDKFMKQHRAEPGSFSILAAMGPGFCAELVLLQW